MQHFEDATSHLAPQVTDEPQHTLQIPAVSLQSEADTPVLLTAAPAAAAAQQMALPLPPNIPAVQPLQNTIQNSPPAVGSQGAPDDHASSLPASNVKSVPLMQQQQLLQGCAGVQDEPVLADATGMVLGSEVRWHLIAWQTARLTSPAQLKQSSTGLPGVYPVTYLSICIIHCSPETYLQHQQVWAQSSMH